MPEPLLSFGRFGEFGAVEQRLVHTQGCSTAASTVQVQRRYIMSRKLGESCWCLTLSTSLYILKSLLNYCFCVVWCQAAVNLHTDLFNYSQKASPNIMLKAVFNSALEQQTGVLPRHGIWATLRTPLRSPHRLVSAW